LALAGRMGHAGGGRGQRSLGRGLLRALRRPDTGGTMTERTLITGAPGVVGGLLAARLVAEVRPVRALVRNLGDRERLPDPRVELAVGSLDDEDSLVRGAGGCEVGYPAAGT